MKLSILTVTIADGPEAQAIMTLTISNDDLKARTVRLTRQELDDLTDWIDSLVR